MFGGGLRPVESAMVVRRSGAEFLVTDGPYVETKEHVGGLWVIQASSLNEARVRMYLGVANPLRYSRD